MLSNCQRVRKVAVHAHPERFNPLQKQERVEGADTRADVAQALHAGLDNETNVAKGVPELQSMIGSGRFREIGEVAVVPGELSAIHDDAANRSTMATHELRQRVKDYVGAVI